MSSPKVETMQALLAADDSPLRGELLGLGFDALVALPVTTLIHNDQLSALVLSALTADNAQRVSDRHVVPALARIVALFAERPETVQDLLPESARARLSDIVTRGDGPRFEWITNTVDPSLVRALVAPIVQQLLLQFAARLPLGGGLGGSQGGQGAIGGIVGRLGRQVQRGAGQLADVGKAVLGGLGGEVERRLSATAREFSESATQEFRTALETRLSSQEGQELTRKLRAGVLSAVLSSSVGVVFADLWRLPAAEIAQVVSETLGHLAREPWFQQQLQVELGEVTRALGEVSIASVLDEAGLLEPTRAYAVSVVDPGLGALFASEPFGAFLERLVEQSS